MKVGLTGKIWMAMAIMIGGFLLIIGLTWKNSFDMSRRLDVAKSGYTPAVAAGTEAQTHLNHLLQRYHRAVILGDPSLFMAPDKDPDQTAIRANLLMISEHDMIDPKHRMDAKRLLKSLDLFISTVEPKYRRLSQGEEPIGDLGKVQVLSYTRQHQRLENQARALKQGLGDRFETELSRINSDLRRQQQVTAFLFLLVTALSVGTAFFVITKYVKEPIQMTARAADSIAGGNFSQRLTITGNDEIGGLGRAFNKMAQNLEETLLGLQEEVKERALAQEALRTNEENLRITLDSIGDAVIATDCDGKITRFNPVAASVTGWSLQEAIGESIGKVLTLLDPEGKHPVEQPIGRVLEHGSPMAVERLTLVAKGGKRKQVAETGSPILNADKETVGVVLVFRDITEQLVRDQQLNQAQKMDSIGQLAGGIAHDFNNMLGAIIGAGEFMRDKINTDPSLEKMVDLILTAADQATVLTQKLLAFSRKGKVNPVKLDIHALIDEVIGLLERSIDKRIILKSVKKANPSIVVGDRSQLLNAIINLGINSRDALPNGGTITFSTETIELTWADCKTYPFELGPGLYVKLKAMDDGMGIPQSIQSKVFDPFFTTKDIGRGTGLGLAAVYGCVKAHNGALAMHSTEGVGTVVEILLPAVESVAPDDSSGERPLQKGSGCILIVDDESLIRKSISLMLDQLGYAHLSAVDGEDGVKVFKASHEAVDLVILDMMMPKMNGADCLAALREIDPDVKVVIASGFADTESLQAVQRQGVSAVMHKPFRLAELGNTLAGILAVKEEPADI